MYIWQNKLFLPNLLYITECFFLDSFFFCHNRAKDRKTPEGGKCCKTPSGEKFYTL